MAAWRDENLSSSVEEYCKDKERGTCSKFLKLTKTLRGIKILFSGHGLKFFSSLRGTNSNTTQYLLQPDLLS